jgi:hypothetical protein
MKNIIVRSFTLVATLLIGIGLLSPLAAHAVTFNSSDLMDDSVMNNYTSMSAGQINSWINTNFPSSCISTNNGFSAPDPTGYNPTNGFIYGSSVSAGQVIYDAAQAYQINPQVLLATLQKEQSIVSGGAGCSTETYTAATGYGCPDSGTDYSYSNVDLYSINGVETTSIGSTCVDNVAQAGFTQQLIHTAWKLEFNLQRSEGNTSWDIQNGAWDNSDDPQTCYYGPMTEGYRAQCSGGSSTYYDGYDTIDGTSTFITTGATAALYYYTPHFSGNENFDNIFSAWFGSLYGDAIEPTVDRLYNPTTGQHYFSAIDDDIASEMTKGFKNDIDSVFDVGTTQGAGMIPIYALYNGRLHDNWLLPDGMNYYWAVNDGGYAPEGIAFYAYPINPSPTPSNPLCQTGTTSVLQMWNPGHDDHFYSILGGDHYWGLIYGGYINDGSSLYTDANGGVSFCVPTTT